MKNSLLKFVVLAGLAIGFAGCTSTDPLTGEKAFDEAKTAMLLAPMEAPIGTAVYIAGKNDPNTKSAFAIAQQVIDNLLTDSGRLSRDEIKARLGDVQISGLTAEENRLVLNMATETVLNYYDVLVAYVLRQEIDKSKALPMIFETISRGIAIGLQADAL